MVIVQNVEKTQLLSENYNGNSTSESTRSAMQPAFENLREGVNTEIIDAMTNVREYWDMYYDGFNSFEG